MSLHEKIESHGELHGKLDHIIERLGSLTDRFDKLLPIFQIKEQPDPEIQKIVIEGLRTVVDDMLKVITQDFQCLFSLEAINWGDLSCSSINAEIGECGIVYCIVIEEANSPKLANLIHAELVKIGHLNVKVSTEW